MKKTSAKTRKERRRKILKSRSERLRLSVFRSNQHIYAQIIDDGKGETLAASSDKDLKKADEKRATQRTQKKTENTESNDSVLSENSASSVMQKKYSKIEIARLVGKLIAKRALEKGIKVVVFDRGGYKFHGQVKALAEGARKGGLEF